MSAFAVGAQLATASFIIHDVDWQTAMRYPIYSDGVR
jgi:hypothetical protein